jgi:hypothetical protein
MGYMISVEGTPMQKCSWCWILSLTPFELIDHQDEQVYSFCSWDHMMDWMHTLLDSK